MVAPASRARRARPRSVPDGKRGENGSAYSAFQAQNAGARRGATPSLHQGGNSVLRGARAHSHPAAPQRRRPHAIRAGRGVRDRRGLRDESAEDRGRSDHAGVSADVAHAALPGGRDRCLRGRHGRDEVSARGGRPGSRASGDPGPMTTDLTIQRSRWPWVPAAAGTTWSWVPALRGDDGSFRLIAPRAVPVEAPAQAAANDVGLEVDAVARHERARAEIDEKVFRLAANARRKGIFDARAQGPARLGIGAAQDRDRRGDGTSDVADRRTAGDVRQEAIEREANPPAHRSEPLQIAVVVHSRDRAATAANPVPVEVPFKAPDQGADLIVEAERTTEQTAADAELGRVAEVAVGM